MNKEGVLLIIDMDANSARLSKDTLEQLCSNKIMVAETISSANNIINEHEVVFIIINFWYNNDECINFIKDIRQNTNGRNYKTPILTFIEDNTSIKPQDVLNAGASKCTLKPFSHNELKDDILDIISNPKNFIMTDNYIGPDRRGKNMDVKKEKRNQR